MSSIRLFILGSLAERQLHGHQLRLLAEEEHVDLWTDFTVGAVYGAIKRLATEGLIEEVRVERQGHYPERQVYGITPAGRTALQEIRGGSLATVVFRPDPVDLALARPDPARLDELADALRRRITVLTDRAREHESRLGTIEKYLTVAEYAVMRHALFRLRAEIDWHEEVLAQVPDIIADERTRKDALHG